MFCFLADVWRKSNVLIDWCYLRSCHLQLYHHRSEVSTCFIQKAFAKVISVLMQPCTLNLVMGYRKWSQTFFTESPMGQSYVFQSYPNIEGWSCFKNWHKQKLSRDISGLAAWLTALFQQNKLNLPYTPSLCSAEAHFGNPSGANSRPSLLNLSYAVIFNFLRSFSWFWSLLRTSYKKNIYCFFDKNGLSNVSTLAFLGLCE